MLKIGCHISSSGGYMAMAERALGIGANVFQFFTRNPRGGQAKALDMDDIAAFKACAAANGIGPILGHASYTINPAAAREDLRTFATETVADDLARLSHTPGSLYNFHPGSHVGQGLEKGVELVAAMLNDVLRPGLESTVLLETMAGKGSELGGRFEDLAAIIERVELKEFMGVCLDTCHVFDGGYDVRDNLEGVLGEFDRVIGLGRLKAVHLNDSLNALGSKKDRHAKIGEGSIGLEGMARIINHPALRELPFYLETPNELPGYAEEIASLKSLYNS